jgi:hypothetical protein
MHLTPYRIEEGAWLKKHYGCEYKFLQCFSLSVYKEEDREDGRQTARSMMADDDEPKGIRSQMRDIGLGGMGYGHEDEDNGENESDDFLEDLEFNPMSQLAGSNFSQAEPNWVKKHYKYSLNFMVCYGLKPFRQEDCPSAKDIVNGNLTKNIIQPNLNLGLKTR